MNPSSFQEIEDVLERDWPEAIFEKVKTEERALGDTSEKKVLVAITYGPNVNVGSGVNLGKAYPDLGGLTEEGHKEGKMEHIVTTTTMVSSCKEQAEKRSRHTYFLPWGKEKSYLDLYEMAKNCLGEAEGKGCHKFVVVTSDNLQSRHIRKILECVSIKRDIEIALVVPPRPKQDRPRESVKKGVRSRGREPTTAVLVKAGTSTYKYVLRKVFWSSGNRKRNPQWEGKRTRLQG